MEERASGVYRPRNPRRTGFYRLVKEHYEEFERVYPERYEKAFGQFRPVIKKVVKKYLSCGDLRRGFARVRCPGCGHEYLLPFSCKERYFCTSCHTKRATVFAERLNETVLHPVPHRVLRLLLDKGRLKPGRVKMLLGWRHSGFNLDASVRVEARDGRGRENISRYIIRAPFSVGKLRYLAGKNTVIYKTKMVKGLNRNFGLYTSLDFLAAVTSHIPDEWEHLTRYYGYYSSVQRGKRIKAGLEERESDQVTIEDDSPGASAARRNWARFIKKIYEVDPLLCPECGGTMRIIAFIEDAMVIRHILRHVGLWKEPEPRPPPVIPPPLTIDIECVPCFE